MPAGIDSYTKLMLHFNGSVEGSPNFIDHSFSGKTVTRYGDTKMKTDNYKFGGASGYFDGSGDYLVVSSSDDFNFYTSDFTIDFWLFCSVAWSSMPYSPCIVGQKKV